MQHEILVGVARAVVVVFAVCWVALVVCNEPVKTRRNELFGAMLLLAMGALIWWMAISSR